MQRLTRLVFIASFLLLWAISPRLPPFSDAATIVDVARGIALEGRIHLDAPSPGYSVVGPDGRHYAKFPLLASLVGVPAQWLERLVSVAAINQAQKELYLRLIRGLTPAAVSASAMALLVATLLALAYRRRTTILVAAAYLLATCALPYLRSPWSEAVQLCAINLCLFCAVRFAQAPGPGRAAALGLAVGLVYLAKPVLLPFALALGVAVAASAYRQVLWVILGLLPPVLVGVAYDIARSGSPFMGDYGLYLAPVAFTHPLLDGLYGLLLSPGRGLFWYAPLAVLSAVGAVLALRQGRRDPLLMGVLVGVALVLVLYAKFTVWHGGEQWGPRFLVPLAGGMAVLGAPVMTRLAARGHLFQAVAPLLAALGLAVNIPGLLISPTDFFAAVPHRPYSEVRLDADYKPLEPVEEDNLYLVNYVPQYSPIRGHFWLLGHAILGGDPAEDVPWAQICVDRPALRTPVDPRLDLWFILDAGWPEAARSQATLMLLVMLLATGAAVFELVRSVNQEATPRT